MVNLKIWLARKELKVNISGSLVEIIKFSSSSDNNHLFLLLSNRDLLYANLIEGGDEVTFSKLYHNVVDVDCSFLNLYLVSVNGRLFKSDWNDVRNFHEVEFEGDDKYVLRAVACFKCPDKESLCLVDTSGNLWLKENGKSTLIEFLKEGDTFTDFPWKEKYKHDIAITAGIDFGVVLIRASSLPYNYDSDSSMCLHGASGGYSGNLRLHSEDCPCEESSGVSGIHSDDERRDILLLSNTLVGKSAVHVGQLLLDTEVWTFGHNRRGQLGVGDQVPRESGAVCVRQLRRRGLKNLASGLGHSVAVAVDGRAWAWGDDSSGQLGSKLILEGLGSAESRTSISSPRAITWPPPTSRKMIVDAAAGDNHTILLADCGSVGAVGKYVSNSVLKSVSQEVFDFSSDDNNSSEIPVQVFAAGNFSACVYSPVSLKRVFPELDDLIRKWRELLSQSLVLHSELFPLKPSSPLNKGKVSAANCDSNQQNECDLLVQVVLEGHRRILALITLTVEALGQYEHHVHLVGEHPIGKELIPPISHCSEFIKVYRTYLEAVCDLLALEGFRDLRAYPSASVQRIQSLLPKRDGEARVVADALFSPLSHQRLYLRLVELVLARTAAGRQLSTQPKVSLSVPELASPSLSGIRHSRSESVSLSYRRGSAARGFADEEDGALEAWRSLGKEWERLRWRAETTREFWEDGARGGLVLGGWRPGACGGWWHPRRQGQRVVRESWVRGGGWSRGLIPRPSLWVARPGTLFTSAASASASPSLSTPSLVLLSDAFLQVAPNGTTTVHSLALLWVQPLRDDSWEREQSQIPQNALKVTMPEDTLTVVASTAEERVTWLKVFNSTISSCLQMETPAITNLSLDSPPASRNSSHLFQRHPVYKNATYTGGWLMGVPHGKGLMLWPDGRRIEGVFKDGVVSGHATCVNPSVGTYEGQWKDGYYCGYGVMRYTNGAVYEGEWRNGVPEGHGIRKEGHFLSSVASVYVGDWVAGCKHGYGVMDDILTGQKYLGMWEKDERSGNGLIVSLDGIYHEGTFVRGSISGHGVMVLEEGTHYEGELRGIGVFGGRGCLTIAPGGHRLEGFLSGSWESGVKVNGGTFHFKRAPTSPSSERPPPSLALFSHSSSPTPSSFGKLCVPASKKWKSLFQLCREELGLKAEEDEDEYVVVSDLKGYSERVVVLGEGVDEESWQRVWENVAVAITRSQLRLKQRLQQRGREGTPESATSAATSEDSISHSGDDGLITIPHFGRKFLDKKSYGDIQLYLLKATESRHHPLGSLVSSLASAFNATYGGVRVHPLLLPHAVSELASLTVRLYAICRLLFPALPSYPQEVILSSSDSPDASPRDERDDIDLDDMVVTSSGLLHPILMPRVYSSLFVLYALHNKSEDDAYWQRLLKWNKLDNLSLMTFLEVNRVFWGCTLEMPLVPPTPAQSPQHGHTFTKAVETLQQLKTTFCPIEKLQVIRKTFERMAFAIQKLKADSQQFGMDDLFPLFNFIVIKAQILQLGSEIHFVEDFMDSHLRHGELGMMFTTLKACYYQILQEKVG